MEEERKDPALGEEEEEDYYVDIVTLTDEDGKDTTFELADTIDYDGNEYAVLLPYAGDDPEEYLQEPCEAIILKKIEKDGEIWYGNIEDDDEYEAVYDIASGRLSDLYDFE